MCCGNNGWGGSVCLWIIILILILFCCNGSGCGNWGGSGCGNWGGSGCGCGGHDDGCGC